MEPEHKESISEIRQTSNIEDGYKKDILVIDFQQCMYICCDITIPLIGI